MGVHESQSLLWERMIFQSPEFWYWITPIVHKHFPHTSGVTAEQFYEFVNQVSPSFIRVDADELTYPLHIIIRYEIEKGLFDGSVTTDKIPSIWNKKMKENLDIIVGKDSQGCLQDIHWSLGSLGYFPSYTLGAMIAAQLFETAEKQIPDLKTQIRNGEFKQLREWLRVNVHEVGSLYESPDELLTVVTGKPLDPAIYVNYLNKKYSALYKL
jgi:Zn-dependent M32 family carboxypeptidase